MDCMYHHMLENCYMLAIGTRQNECHNATSAATVHIFVYGGGMFV